MPDRRTKIEKLRAMANQTASPNEAATARRLLAKMGVPVVEPARAYSTYEEFGRPRARPRPFTEQSYNDLREQLHRMTTEELMRTFEAAFFREQRRRGANPFEAAGNEYERRTREREQAEFRAANAEGLRRDRIAKMPCPGCLHFYADHVGIRCYGCYRERVPNDVDRRADVCGWGAVEMKSGDLHWYEVKTSWQTGPQFTYDEGGS